MASSRDIRAGRAYVSMSLRDTKLARGLAGAQRKLRSFGGDVQRVGRQLFAIGAAAGAGLAVASRIFASFDDQMRTVAAVTGAADQQLHALTSTARELGRTTSFTASQVAALMVELGRAGFDPTQIDKMTGSVLNLAKATGTEAATAAGIAAATIRQFGLEAGQAGRVADVLATGANKSFNTLESLGDALKFAGPIAADLNLSLEDTVALLGALGNVGIQGGNAGTAVRRLLALTAADAEGFGRNFGVEVKTAAGNARPLLDVLGDIDQATRDLGSADRAARLKDAFGLLGITAASALSKNTLGVADLKRELDAAQGAAQRTADAMEAGPGGAMRRLLSALEGVALAIGSAISGPLIDAANRVAKVAGETTQFVKANDRLVIGLAKLAAILVTVGGGLAALGVAIAGVGAAAGSLSVLLSPLLVIPGGIAAGVAGMIAAFNGGEIAGINLGKAMLKLAHDLGLVKSAALELEDANKRLGKAGLAAAKAQDKLAQAKTDVQRLAAASQLVDAIEQQIQARKNLIAVEREQLRQRVQDARAELDLANKGRLESRGPAFTAATARVVDAQAVARAADQLAKARADLDRTNADPIAARLAVRLADAKARVDQLSQSLAGVPNKLNVFAAVSVDRTSIAQSLATLRSAMTDQVHSLVDGINEAVKKGVQAYKDRIRAISELKLDLAIFSGDDDKATRLRIEQESGRLKERARELGILTKDLETSIDEAAKRSLENALGGTKHLALTVDRSGIVDARAIQSLAGGSESFQKRTAAATERTAKAVERMQSTNTLRFS